MTYRDKVFRDRAEAARELARALGSVRGEHPLILAIPRGAVPIGAVLADELGGELDVCLVRKIGAPGNEELAIGAVGENGEVLIGAAARLFGLSAEEVRASADVARAELQRRRALYTRGRPVPIAGRVVVLVDDGIATGATMLAAARAVRARRPARLVIATPVASREASQLLEPECDRFVALGTPLEFGAVSRFYEHFEQVSDDEVIELLGRFRRASQAASGF